MPLIDWVSLWFAFWWNWFTINCASSMDRLISRNFNRLGVILWRLSVSLIFWAVYILCFDHSPVPVCVCLIFTPLQTHQLISLPPPGDHLLRWTGFWSQWRGTRPCSLCWRILKRRCLSADQWLVYDGLRRVQLQSQEWCTIPVEHNQPHSAR